MKDRSLFLILVSLIFICQSAYGFDNDEKNSSGKFIQFFLGASSQLAIANNDMIVSALQLVTRAIQDEVTAISVSEQEYLKGDAQVAIHLFDHSDFISSARKISDALPLKLSNLDAYYLEIEGPIKNQSHIFIDIDSIFLDKNGNEKADGFARLITVFAHEFYGNAVRRHSEVNRSKRESLVDYYQTEILAYSRGIKLLKKIITLLGSRPGAEATVLKLKIMIESEQLRMNTWQEAVKAKKRAKSLVCKSLLG